MVLVVAVVLGSVTLAVAAAWLVLRAELRAGLPPRLSWRLGLSAVQAWVAGGVVGAAALLSAFGDVLRLSEEAHVADLAVALERVAVSAALLWIPFAFAVAAILVRCVWTERKREVNAPLFAVGLYLVAVVTLGASGLLPLG